jgi:N-acetylglutamate synthase-like GNAT family acetyltransferase
MTRSAERSDFKAIRATWRDAAFDPLHTARTLDGWLDVKLSGFLVSDTPSRKEFKAHLDRYIVSERAGRLGGLLRLDDSQEIQPETDVHWVSPHQFKDLYEARPHASIGVIAVAQHAARQGVATEMLHEAEVRARAMGASHLFSFVVLCPIANYSSALFHLENGFEMMAVTQPQTLFDVDDYQSTLYGKGLA